MHFLHKILVKTSDALADRENLDRDGMVSAIRCFAEDETERYYEQAFDWRETANAGGWTQLYPENVILGEENPDRLVEELNAARKGQLNEIQTALKQIKENEDTDLEKLCEKYIEAKTELGDLTVYYLFKLSCLLLGHYQCDSHFYNTHEWTARILPEDIEEVKENPKDWALVMFDYHF